MRRNLVLGLVLALGFAAGQVFSKDDPGRQQEETIKAMEAYGKVGPQHEFLKKLEGNFDSRSKATLDPAAAPKESTGKVESKLIFGGLFVKEDVNGTCPITGKKFHGVCYTGFDNAKKKYVSTWIDSLGSGIHYSEGVADPSGKSLELRGTCVDPLTGKDKNVREVRRILDDKQQILEMYEQGADGREVKCFEVDLIKK